MIMTQSSGIAMIEVLVAIFVMALLSVAAFSLAGLGIRTAIVTEYRSVAQGIATSEIEKVNQLAYEDVGLSDGSVPDGLLSPSEQISQNGQVYDVIRSATLVDDAQNGTLSVALDEDNADYKQVTVTVTPPKEPNSSVTFSTLAVRQIPPVTLPDPVAHWSFTRGDRSCLQGDSYADDDVGVLNGRGKTRTSCDNWPDNSGAPQLGEAGDTHFVYNPGDWFEFGGSYSPIAPPITFTDSYTLAMWVKPNLSPSNPESGLLTYNNNLANVTSSTFEWYLERAGKIALRLTDNRKSCAESSARNSYSDNRVSFTPGQWQHIAVIYNSANNTVQHFMNGEPGQVISILSPAKNCGAPGFFAMGTLIKVSELHGRIFPEIRDQRYYAGGMDEVRIYDRVLDDAQVRFLAQGNS